MTVQDASHLWFFESHSNAKRSQWLQSTLSELEEKTKRMLKLIEGNADSFAQRAEMYYKKRPELINMIEDFYRSYRSLAESYDQLKFDSGSSFSNRGFSLKEWSFIDKSSASSYVTFDSESEVDDPIEEKQVESKLTVVQEMKKREKSNFLTYSEIEETQVEYMLEKFPDKENETCVVKPVIEKIKTTTQNISKKENAVTASKIQIIEGKSSVNAEEEEAQGGYELKEFKYCSDNELSNVSYTSLEESQEALNLEEFSIKGEMSVVKPMMETIESTKIKSRNVAEKRIEHFEPLHSELNEGRNVDKLIYPWVESNAKKLISEVEKLKKENANFKVELERKDEEKREVIRQLSSSVDILKGENDSIKKFIRDSKKQSGTFDFGKLKGALCKNLFGRRSKFPTTMVAL